MINVMIADDQELICQSLEIVIKSKSDMKVVAIANNGWETVDLAKKHKPDVLLLDIRMPGINGVECIKILKEKKLETKIIILTTFDDDEYIFEAVKNGASGYLLKGISLDELVKSIRLVANGGTLINPDVATKVCKLFSEMAKSNYIQKVDDTKEKNNYDIFHTSATEQEIKLALKKQKVLESKNTIVYYRKFKNDTIDKDFIEEEQNEKLEKR